jgi:N12 class adenine-specific DNA methylase/adenine-specific DNA methylase
MPSKTEEYLALAQRTANGLTRYWESWTDYLTTASRLYKYPFADQLIIYAQRPDATACAEFDIWRNRMNRYVRRGSKGIALLDESSGFPRLHYVFDVSDTGVRRNSRDPEVWQLGPDLVQPVSEMLAATYGISGERVSQQLADVAGKLVADYWDNNSGDILAIVDGSLLMDYDEAGVEMQFKSAAAISVTYTLLERCGFEPAGWFDKDDFQAIYNFSTPDSVYALGAAVSDMSREVLRNIERTVKTTIRRRNAERSQYEYEQQERDLLDRRGLPSPEPDPESAPEAAGQVRQAAPDVPDEPSPGTVQHDAPEREPVPAPDGGGADGREPDAADHGAASETEPGSGQGAESDGMGAAHEQPESASRGTGADGTDLQLSFFDAHIPTEVQQIEAIDQAESEKTPSAFVLSQAEIENELRKHGSGFEGGKQRIMTLYQAQPDRSLRAKALAKEYGTGGHSYDFLDGSRGFVNHDWKGLEFDHYPDHQKITLKWAQVEKYIDLMIQSDRYLTDKEKEHYTPPSPVSAKPDADLTHAKNLIRDFCLEEYDSEPDFSDLSKIGVAYTNATDEDIPIQVNVDLVGYRVERYLGEVLIDERQYESLEDLTETELEALDFSELVSVTDEELEHYHSKAEERPALLPLDAATEYNALKEQHPDALVGFEQNGQFEFYADDAQKVSELLGGKLLEKETALGTVPVIGFPRDQWAHRAKQLWQCGENVYLAGLNEDGTHHQTKYLRREDYLPLGTTIHMEGRAFRVDNVNFDKDSVTLQDVALAEMRMPIFREEPLALVRELYEEQDMMGHPLPDYKVGDNVIVDLPTRTIEGKIGYVGETDVRIDTSAQGQSWDNEVINKRQFEDGLRQNEQVTTQPDDTVKTVAVYPAEENRMPYDIVIQTIGSKSPTLDAVEPERSTLELAGNFRAENRENFERMLSRDERNAALRTVAGEHPSEIIPETKQERRYLVAAYHHFENGFDDKLDYYTLEEAEKAAHGYVDGTMEDDGFKYDGAAVYDQQEHKCIRIYGDYPDEKAHAQVRASAEPEQQEPEHFIDHFYVAEDIQKRGSLDIKEYSSFDDALRAYYALPDTQRKALGAMNTRDLPGSLDFVQCVNGKDTIIQDYAKVDGWQNAEVMDIIAQLEQSITTREIPPVPAVNFHITDDNIGDGGPKQKFARNIEAIRTLFKLEKEHRGATAEEQQVLSQYVGWGGLADAFDPGKDNWAKEYAELKGLLSEDEYAAARSSTLNAHYTSPTVIRSIYDAVERMGFRSGNILEPSMGVGNFFGMLPDTMQDSRLYGVELDSITGRIAKKLYPQADITVAGFETTDRRDFYDLAVGNVPFGQYKVNDKAYNKLGFSIHNYFFAKAIDQVRPGGVVAFVTSRYTMDSKDSTARKHMAERADLLGAIRLPNNAFRANAGTDVVSDIIFLQKRDRPIDHEPDWVQLGKTEDGFAINQYFADHPEMVLGVLSTESTQYGREELTVAPIESANLADQLAEAVQHIEGQYTAAEVDAPDIAEEEATRRTLPADPEVKNFSYTVVDGEVFYRENSVMTQVELSDTAKGRVTGMVELRQIVNELIDQQLNDYPDEDIQATQAKLNAAYDAFTAKYGLLNDRKNGRLFEQDSSYYLLCSLENLDEQGQLKSKAAMFTKRTIRPERTVTSVDTPSEALAVSIGEHGRVDLPYMAELLGTPGEYDRITTELSGVIFKDPAADPTDPEAGWQMADEYLSGDVRAKLRMAQFAAETNPEFAVNVTALEKAQPRELEASEIDVRLGATWLDPDIIQKFMTETFQIPYYLRHAVKVRYSPYTAEWRVEGKTATGRSDIISSETYGTSRANAYKILEETLNLKDVRIYDTIEDAEGKPKRVLNKRETMLAQQKQQVIKDAFANWVWQDPQRRIALVRQYNELFNSTRPREYDGSHIHFVGMNPEISLREHQRNAIAHVLYGGNTLLAHEVGAGKTFEMAASAMEAKRLGLCQKSLFVVPNHLTEQWASEFLHLYPNAKLLVARRKDFETANRKKFCARIATGDYDAVIIGHSQFERIPLSFERQERIIQEQIYETLAAINELKVHAGENFSIKQMEKTRKTLETKLEKLRSDERKDDVITFEQLGVDRLFVDESHAFKNLFLTTKMRNVAGLSTSEAQKSSDMFGKCRYLDEITGGRGVVFATGTPVSNSMTELYTVMRYLQYSTLRQKKLTHFDCWASTFGETTTAIELAPEGTGYRARTRFAKFFNLPELMSMFKEVADIKTSDQLHLPVPEAKFETVVAKPSEIQKEMVQELSKRAADIHSGIVDASVDNMLCVTNDGRKIGLDVRLMNPMLPDDPNSKLNVCVQNVLKIWEEGKDQKLTQLLFCDLSTPKNDGNFNVYDDIRKKLIAAGVPENEIEFIHNADTEAKKAALFSKVRSGDVRVLLGSTAKMGAGTNVQSRLVAVHHLDVGWKPSDMTQRNGRIIRQGNMNKEVKVFNYVTEGTFDSYLFQTLENKQRFISQIMTSKSPVRSCEDVDEQALSYAEIKALCAGNPLIKEKMDLDVQVAKLKVLKADHQSQKFRLQDKLLTKFPADIQEANAHIAGLKADAQLAAAHPQGKEEFCGMTIRGVTYDEKKTAGERLVLACSELPNAEEKVIGSYRGFELSLRFDAFRTEYQALLKGQRKYTVPLGNDPLGNIIRLDNSLNNFPERINAAENELTTLHQQQAAAQIEVEKPFPQEEELAEKSARLAELNAQLDVDEKSHEPEQDEEEQEDAPRRPSVLAALEDKSDKPEPVKPFRSYYDKDGDAR